MVPISVIQVAFLKTRREGERRQRVTGLGGGKIQAEQGGCEGFPKSHLFLYKACIKMAFFSLSLFSLSLSPFLPFSLSPFSLFPLPFSPPFLPFSLPLFLPLFLFWLNSHKEGEEC